MMNVTFKSITFFVFAWLTVLHVGCITQQKQGLSPVQPSDGHAHHTICLEGTTPISQNDSTTPQETEESYLRLNDYGCIYDNFSTTIEVGNTYIYANKNEDAASHIKILQVLSGDTALAIRYPHLDYYDGKVQPVYEKVIFFIQATSPYADGSRLREGKYLCTGIRQHTMPHGDIKTLYVLEEQK